MCSDGAVCSYLQKSSPLRKYGLNTTNLNWTRKADMHAEIGSPGFCKINHYNKQLYGANHT